MHRPALSLVVVLASVLAACGAGEPAPSASAIDSPQATQSAGPGPNEPEPSSASPAADTCPDGQPTLAGVIAVAAAVRLACFGGDGLLTLRGWTWEDRGARDCHVPAGPPHWLACSATHARLTTLAYLPADPSVAQMDPADGPLRVAFDPAGPGADALTPNQWVEVRGRFGDPATESCEELGPGFREECLATFVIAEAHAIAFPEVLAPEAWAIISVNDLRVRSEPRLDAEVVDAALAAGDRVFVTVGPFAVDGQWWYGVSYGIDYATGQRTGWPRFGFVAAGEAGAPFLEQAPANCAGASADVEQIVGLTAFERLQCLGGQELTLQGYLHATEFGTDGSCPIAGEIPAWEPKWLAFGCGGLQANVNAPFHEQLPLHVPPALAPTVAAASGGTVRVVGHFDDGASAGCHDQSRPPVAWALFLPPTEDAAIVLRCREAFVVTAIEALGP